MKNYKFKLWFLVSIILFAIIGAFAKIMSGFDHNEHMYITASFLVAQNKEIYRDFAFVQTPYLPLLYGNLYRLLGVTAYYFFIGKIISFIFLGISASVIFLLSRRVLNDIFLSLCIIALFLLNATIVNPATEVSNYIMPLAFSLASFYVLYISITKNRIKPFGIALAGIFLAIAIGTKLTYLTAIIPFIAVICFYSLISEYPSIPNRKEFVYIFFLFIAGVIIGLLPMFFFMSDIHLFFFNNLGFHIVNTHWRQITGYNNYMSLFSKLVYAREVYFNVNNLILMLSILFGFKFSINSFRTIWQNIKQSPTGLFLSFLLVLVAIPTALAPTPSFPQYYAMPVSFLFLLLIYSCVSKTIEILALHRTMIFIFVLVSVVYNGPLLLKPIVNLTHRDKYAGLNVHDVSMNIKNVLMSKAISVNGKIATLSPLFVIESNLGIYPELSTGPFLYRIGDLLTPKQRKHFVGTSMKNIGNLFVKDPPVAILVGFEESLDEPLVEYAIANKYREIDVAGFNGRLYVQP